MDKRLYTWDEINDPAVVNYRERSDAIHARRYTDDAGYRAACAHWDKVREQIKNTAPALPPDWKSPLTLAEQADKQIALLERDLKEWREIKARAAKEVGH